MFKDKLRKIRGFALVEFIVVMIVIAVLIALALPYYNGMTAKALETKLRNDARVVQDACDYFYGHNGDYPYLLDSDGNKIIAANNNGYFDVIYKVVDFDPNNTDVNFYEIDFNKLRSYLNVDSNQGYFLAAHSNSDFGIVVLNPASRATQDRVEKGYGVVSREKPVIQMDYPEDGITTDTIITWSYTYDYDILEEEWEGKQESYPEEGEYTVRLRVKNQNGVWSDWADISFYVFNKDEVVQVAAGYYHTVALKTDGTVWSWGRNNYGQLGDNSSTESHIPVQVVDASSGTPLSNIKSIAAGYYHNMALKNDGTVWSWGYNYFGQLGDGEKTDRHTPVQVRAGASSGTYLSNVKAIAAGYYHNIALKNDGTVWSWGRNIYGQLGYGETTTSNSTPVQVVGASGETCLSNVKSIAAGFDHTVALKNDGTVWSWGWNKYGQLGDGETTDSSIPVQVVGVSGETCLSNVKSIAAGNNHIVALKNDGTVWSWGYNYYGQLGDGETTDSSIPVQVKDGASGGTLLSNIESIAAGDKHTVALKNDGTVWSWGYNGYGQLGDGETTDKHTPVQVKAGASGGTSLSNIESIAAGCYHNIALKNDGTVWSWGYNNRGQLGDGETTDKHTPVQTIFPR